MDFNWFLIFNKQDFAVTGLLSRTVTAILEGIGQRDILVTSGNELSILYDGVFLPTNFTGKNPFIKDECAVFEDEDGNIWLGVLK